jgi:hypothetical protein
MMLGSTIEYNNGGKDAGWTKTPNINALASKGVRLNRYYTNPICSPSRATIMTGRYTIRTGIQHSCYSAAAGTGLPLNERTIANALADEGYENWALGKVSILRTASYTSSYTHQLNTIVDFDADNLLGSGILGSIMSHTLPKHEASIIITATTMPMSRHIIIRSVLQSYHRPARSWVLIGTVRTHLLLRTRRISMGPTSTAFIRPCS